MKADKEEDEGGRGEKSVRGRNINEKAGSDLS